MYAYLLGNVQGGVRNPSAALLARLRGTGPPGLPKDGGTSGPLLDEVEDFLLKYGLETWAHHIETAPSLF